MLTLYSLRELYNMTWTELGPGLCYTMTMIYVALLRGINVGGNNKVEMKRLKETFERVGLSGIKTYINSGNVIFSDNSREQKELADSLEKAIEEDFGFAIQLLLRSVDNIQTVVDAMPESWVNDATMKCDVMFLWEDVDSPRILDQLVIKPEMEDVKYMPGALIWRVDRPSITRSGMMRLVSSELYKKMTIRNCNTARKLLLLMKS